MASNSTRLIDSLCLLVPALNASKITSLYYHATLTTCVVTSLLAPMAVVGNVLIMAAVWRNPSLRTPSYVLLAGLAFTDFSTGLLSQPLYVVQQLAELFGNRKMLCIARLMTGSVGIYLSSLTVAVMTLIAVERWLHMSRITLLSVRRVTILYIALVVSFIPFVGCYIYGSEINRTSVLRKVTLFSFMSGAAICFALNIFAYFKVYRIIRHHQSQVQTNQNAIDIEKYKKSVFTILYIVAIFLLSYLPYVCTIVFLEIVWTRPELPFPVFKACTAFAFSSSLFNPLLCYWRIKEIRDSVRAMVRKFC